MLKAFDMFKGNPQMHFKGEKGGYSSWLGQITTILVLGLGLSLLIYFCLDMILRTNPQIQSSPLAEIDDIIITDESFPFAFGLKDATGKFYIDERIYTVEAISDNLRIPYIMIPCKPTNFEGYDPENDGPLWCFSKEQNPGIIVKTSSADVLTINLHKCDKTVRQDCFEEGEIDKLLAGNRVGIYRKQFGYNSDNYENPITERTVYVGASVSNVIVKESYLFLNRYYYDTDDGWLFSNVHRNIKINADSFIEYFEDKEVMGNIFKQIGFDTNNQSVRLLRKYDNLPSIFARWNGMFTLMLIFGKVISDAYNQFKTQEALIKDILSIKNRKIRAKNIRNRIKEDQVYTELCDIKFHFDDKQLLQKAQKDEEASSSNRFKEMKNDPPAQSSIKSSIFCGNAQLNSKSCHINQKDRLLGGIDSLKTIEQGKYVQNTEDLEEISSKRKNDEARAVELEMCKQDGRKTIHLEKKNYAIQEPDMNQHLKAPKGKKSKKSMNLDFLTDQTDELPEIGFWKWFWSKLKPNQQYKMFLEREKLIQKEFDFQSHIKRSIEVDVLKYLFLTKTQLALFENCMKAYVNSKLHTTAHKDNNSNKPLKDYGKISYSPDEEDEALIRLRQMNDIDATTRKILQLLEVLFPVEEKD